MKTNQKTRTPTLRFTPTAWAKLLFLRDCGDTEVGGFGIAPSDDLLLIEDIQLVGQTCTLASVDFDDESVTDYFDRQVDAGLRPEQFARVWIHTHPGDSPYPSGTDEETFAKVFGRSDWSVMFILACGGQTYARLQFNQGVSASVELDVEIDYLQPFAGSDQEAWEAEYDENVLCQVQQFGHPRWLEQDDPLGITDVPGAWHDAWHQYSDDESQEIFAHEQFA